MISYSLITWCFLAAVLCFFVEKGEAIQCYECNSHNDSRCAYKADKLPEALKHDCAEHKDGQVYTMCRKITQVIEFEVNGMPPDNRVIRGCGYEESNYKGRCYQRSGFGGRQEVCSCLDNYCNSAGVATATLLTLLGALLFIRMC